MFQLVTVGHFAIDLITSPRIKAPKPTLGGSPTYVSLAARKLRAEVSVISKVGDDFPPDYLSWLKGAGVDLSGLKRLSDVSTTRFLLKYENNKRKMLLQSRAPPICVDDVPHSLRAMTVHVAPIANEVREKTIIKLRELTDVLSLDPQGFLRGFDREGNVYPKRWNGHRVLELVDIYKSSEEEICLATKSTDLRRAIEDVHNSGPKIILVTKGMHGSMMFFDDALYDVPACKPSVILDPTGAGDAFVGAFLAEYLDGKDAIWCACVGSASASFVVEGVGPERFGKQEEVYARAKEIYEKGIMQSKI